MAASTTPVTPVQLYAMTDDTKHGIPKTLDELGIATKQEVSAAATAAETHLANGENTTVTGSGAIGDPVKVNTPTVTLKIVSGKYVLTNEAGTQVTIDPSAFVAAASPNGIKVAPDGRLYVEVKPDSKLEIDGVNYKHTNESGVATVIQPGQFVAGVAGNAITTAPDGRLVVQIPAQLPDNQVFSGDNSGTVSLVLTPTTINAGTPDEQTNYTIKADLKIAATNPDGSANRLKWSPLGFWVEIKDVFCE
jgi:hypothetical protein